MYDEDALPPSMICYAKWKEDQYLIVYHVSESFSVILDPVTGIYFGQSGNAGHRLELELVPSVDSGIFSATLDLYDDDNLMGTHTWPLVTLNIGPPTNSGLLTHQLPHPLDLAELQIRA